VVSGITKSLNSTTQSGIIGAEGKSMKFYIEFASLSYEKKPAVPGSYRDEDGELCIDIDKASELVALSKAIDYDIIVDHDGEQPTITIYDGYIE
jgi:hypothetical protein